MGATGDEASQQSKRLKLANEHEVQEHVAYLQNAITMQKKPPPTRAKAKPPPSKAEQKLIRKRKVIFLRFGSDHDFTHRYMKFRDIHDKLYINLNTCMSIIRCFRDNGYSFERKPRQFKQKKLTGELLQEVTSKETLSMWRGRSLADRCRTIRFQHNVKVSASMLF